MAFEPLRVACVGMGWWSDVLADAVKRSGKIEIVACYTRSEDKRKAFGKKYGCTAAASYEAVLADPAHDVWRPFLNSLPKRAVDPGEYGPGET